MKMLLLALVGVASAMVIPKEYDVLNGLQNRVIPEHAAKLSGEALTNYVNSQQKFFTAAKPTISLEKVKKRLMKTEFVAPHADNEVADTPVLASIPDSFDSRQQWPNCVSIDNIRDQSDCGSCWAFAASEAISDRTCIGSNGAVNTLLSSEDVLSCCSNCGYGCDGGYPIRAWQWWVSHGYCTGGSYESQFGCKPYSLAPCGETIGNVTWPDCPEDEYDTPTCQNKCTSKNNYATAYKDDKHFGKSAYNVGKTVAAIQTEILTNGPVEAAYTVYEDFYQYKSGVYVHTGGSALGGHAVRILGWGTDNGTPYWLVANSWNVNWGENGYFRIIRGVNECGIEHAIVAGLAK